MAGLSRRRLLGGAAGVAAGAATLSVLPPNLRRAVADPVRHPGSLKNIEHVVILTQENRSFDHYFGTLKGVRGFSDPDALTLPSGKSVFYQPYPDHPDGYLLPFHLDTSTSSAQAMPSTSHSWASQHASWNNGAMDSFVTQHVDVNGDMGPYTMGYYERDDIPFQFALAQSFTVCDAYHCSLLGPTAPNRLFLFTGTIDADGRAGGPVIGTPTPATGLSWTTYPEELTKAGVSWHVYHLDDSKGYNVLDVFPKYQNARPGDPLYEHALTISAPGQFEYDVAHDRLPTVSWILPTSQQSEHPDFLPAVGADFVASKLEALASHPDVWAKTVFILNYDENDGLFDHVPPPTPPAGTADEFVDGVPVGGGFRVPCVIVSPWTVGGYVAPERFDHTSVLQFLERVTGVRASNVSDWRRSTFGDLTSALGFGASRPAPHLPPTKPQLWRAEREVASLPPAPIPQGDQTPPRQNTRKDSSPVPAGPDLPDKLAGKQPFYQRSLDDLLAENPDDPQGFADLMYPKMEMRALAAEFSPQPGTRYVHLASGGSHIHIFDASTVKLVKAVAVGTRPIGVAATPDGKKVYVADSGSSNVAVVDTATATVTANVTVGLFPRAVAVSPDGRYTYVANTGPDTGGGSRGGSRTISVIDTTTDKVVGSAQVGEAPTRIAFAPAGDRAYVACADSLYVLDMARRPHQLDRLTGRERAHGLAVTPDGSEVWVTNPRSDTVTVLDARRLRTKATVPVGHTPWSLAFAGGNGYVVNANSNTLSVVDTRTHRVTRTLAVGPLPVGINTDIEGQAWVTTNLAGHTVQVVDLASGKVTASVTGAYGLEDIAIV